MQPRIVRNGLQLDDQTMLTANGLNQAVTFTEGDIETPADNQVWTLSRTNARHALTSMADATGLAANGNTISVASKSFYLEQALGVQRYAFHTGTGNNMKYWDVNSDLSLSIFEETTPTDYPFEFILVGSSSDITDLSGQPVSTAPASAVFDLQRRRLATPQLLNSSARPNGTLAQARTPQLHKGLYIVNGKKVVR